MVLLVASFYLAKPAFCGPIDDINIEAIKQMRAGQTGSAEKLWHQIIDSADASVDQKHDAKNNLSVLYESIGKSKEANALQLELGPGPGLNQEKKITPTQFHSEIAKFAQRTGQRFQPLEVVNNPNAQQTVARIKQTILAGVAKTGVSIKSSSEGILYRLPGERKALICFDVVAVADGMEQATCSYSITVQDHGNGNIEILDKNCSSGPEELTPAGRQALAREKAQQAAELASAQAQEKAAQSGQSQNSTTKNTEISDTEKQSLADLAKRQKENANSGYMNKYR